jgi:hypothetical protein
MGALRRIGGRATMASRWRRRRMCVLIADHPVPAALREISATGAFLETNARPGLGSSVELHHPDAGAIEAVVRALADDGIELGFACGERSVAFAMAAIAADMSRPAA